VHTMGGQATIVSNKTFYMFSVTALQGNGLKIMILLRLSPLIPYNALDYMSGVTAIPLWSYALALIGILPGTVMFCFIGASASSLTDSTSSGSKTVKIISIVFGVVFALCGVYAASYYSKLELDRVSVKYVWRLHFVWTLTNGCQSLALDIGRGRDGGRTRTMLTTHSTRRKLNKLCR
jgi:hypothetical protein